MISMDRANSPISDETVVLQFTPLVHATVRLCHRHMKMVHNMSLIQQFGPPMSNGQEEQCDLRSIRGEKAHCVACSVSTVNLAKWLFEFAVDNELQEIGGDRRQPTARDNFKSPPSKRAPSIPIRWDRWPRAYGAGDTCLRGHHLCPAAPGTHLRPSQSQAVSQVQRLRYGPARVLPEAQVGP